MSDKPLSQSDIDNLVSRLSASEPAAPKATATAAADTAPPRGATAPPTAASPSKGAPPPPGPPPQAAAVDERTEERLAELAQRLVKVEASLARLDRLEKLIAEAGNTSQLSHRQIQVVVNRVQELNEELKAMSTKLQGTLGYDVYHTFTCDKCGSQGLVAVLFKCTKCTRQSWRGWWPRK